MNFSDIKRGCISGLDYLAKTINFVRSPVIIYHEKCHAIAFSVLFKNVRTEIYLTPSGGQCEAIFNGPPALSRYGKLFGNKKSFALVSAAGPLGEMILSVALYQLFGRNPVISIIRAVQSLTIAGYALSVFEKPIEFLSGNYECYDGHDYRNLRLEGGIVAVHLLIGLAFTNALHSTFPILDYITGA
jgi:hypothetical protein